MARYQKKSTLADVAQRRNQTVAELLTDWGIESYVGLDDHYKKLRARCLKEGIEIPAFSPSKAKVVEKPTPKNAIVDISKKKNEETTVKKPSRSKLTSDEHPSTSDKHVRVDAGAVAGPKDSA